MSLFDRRLLVVQGKGGVGRTTLTAALGAAAARTGRRVCVVELSGLADLARRVGFAEPQYAPRRAAERLDLMSLSPTACMTDFGQRKLKIPAFSRMFFESRPMTGFVESVPGLHDLVQLGKVEDMLLHPLPGETRYDLVVLDAPATGHGLSLLAAARAMSQMTRVGPFFDLANTIEALLHDPKLTASVLVTLPEVLPVNEAMDLASTLVREGASIDALLVNQLVAASLPKQPDVPTLLDGLHRCDAPADVRKALRGLAIRAVEVASRQQTALALLEERLPTIAHHRVPDLRLPRLDHPGRGLLPLEPLIEALTAWSRR
jgi:anion-transporting  ArsA/GET3 family ATPase